MATLTMSPTVRRPFASLDRTRMSLLTAKMNQRNEQNGTRSLLSLGLACLSSAHFDVKLHSNIIFRSNRLREVMEDPNGSGGY